MNYDGYGRPIKNPIDPKFFTMVEGGKRSERDDSYRDPAHETLEDAEKAAREYAEERPGAKVSIYQRVKILKSAANVTVVEG